MNLDLARLQFAITTIYHFLFVPVSIGMAAYVAICQTLCWRTGREVYDRMARFWGTHRRARRARRRRRKRARHTRAGVRRSSASSPSRCPPRAGSSRSCSPR
jgi:hypothetical protein